MARSDDARHVESQTASDAPPVSGRGALPTLRDLWSFLRPLVRRREILDVCDRVYELRAQTAPGAVTFELDEARARAGAFVAAGEAS
jgi:hypothetical protein